MPQSLVLLFNKTVSLPFTLSHIAFALPIKRILGNNISTTGLIIGSMLPDIEYYLRMTMYGTWGHSWKGNVFYEVPMGIIIAFIFHMFIRDTLIHNLPYSWNRRVSKYLSFDWKQYFIGNWFWVIFSMYLGIGTHMILDIFTHEQGYIYGISLEVLDTIILGTPLHAWNQVVLSILGLGFLGIHFLIKEKALIKARPSLRSPLQFWTVFVIGFTLIYTLRVLAGIPEEKQAIQHMVVFCSAVCFSLLITSLLWKFRRK